MKFGIYLKDNLISEWKSQYIHYALMKQMIATAIQDFDSSNLTEKQYFSKFEKEFFSLCNDQLLIINEFYKRKIKEAQDIYTQLCYDFEQEIHEFTDAAQTLHHFRGYFSELYLSLIFLTQYQDLNYIGFQKILKKYDKNFHGANGVKWFQRNVDKSDFHKKNDTELLMKNIENYFTIKLMHGNRKLAMDRLRLPPLHQLNNIKFLIFRCGLLFGIFIILLILLYMSIFYNNNLKISMEDLILFRAPLLIIETIMLCGFNVFIWRLYGINYILIFQIDIRNHLNEYHIMELGLIFGIIWSTCVLCFLHNISFGISIYIPIILIYIIMIVFLINPFDIIYHYTRKWILHYMWRIIIAPYHKVKFVDFWLCDQFTSLTTAFHDMHYFPLLVEYMVTSTSSAKDHFHHDCDTSCGIISLFIAIMPYWCRFMQASRRIYETKHWIHVFNAGKYASALAAAITKYIYEMVKGSNNLYDPWFYFMAIVNLFASCYTSLWDIKKDWGLFDVHNHGHKFLRTELLYPFKCIYYIAIIENIILRFNWIFGIYLTIYGYINKEVMVTILAVLEIFRRFVWNLFRLENEHLNNCGLFRAVQDIPISNTEMIHKRASLTAGTRYHDISDKLGEYRGSLLEPEDREFETIPSARSSLLFTKSASIHNLE